MHSQHVFDLSQENDLVFTFVPRTAKQNMAFVFQSGEGKLVIELSDEQMRQCLQTVQYIDLDVLAPESDPDYGKPLITPPGWSPPPAGT